LRSTIAEAYSIDVYRAVASEHGLGVGLVFWIPAIALAIGYFVFLYRSFRGKVEIGGR
jgi:cytochrome d ubiquinol oxidase subunit II